MIWSIQVLRFVAALMVVYIHAVVIAVHVTDQMVSFPLEWQTSAILRLTYFL